nr:hypothetical protein [Mucilaginibacter sp. FT3.2]
MLAKTDSPVGIEREGGRVFLFPFLLWSIIQLPSMREAERGVTGEAWSG